MPGGGDSKDNGDEDAEGNVPDGGNVEDRHELEEAKRTILPKGCMLIGLITAGGVPKPGLRNELSVVAVDGLCAEAVRCAFAVGAPKEPPTLAEGRWS